MSARVVWDCVVTGAGPAGLAAGMYLARAGFRVRIVRDGPPGGQARHIARIENYPGFPAGISGRALMERFAAQALRWGARFERAEVRAIARAAGGFSARTSRGALRCRAVLLCPGTAFRRLGCPGERRLQGKGVYHCAFDLAPGFKDKDVAVVGGGEAAAHQALHLSRFARWVHLLCRGGEIRAVEPLRRRLEAAPGVRKIFRTEVVRLCGRARLEALRVRNLDSGRVWKLPVAAAFVLVGKEPDRRLTPPGKLPQGIFAAGDARQPRFRQVAVASGDGIRAAMACERYLRGWSGI